MKVFQSVEPFADLRSVQLAEAEKKLLKNKIIIKIIIIIDVLEQ